MLIVDDNGYGGKAIAARCVDIQHRAEPTNYYGTSIYNLTQPEATGLVHYGPDDFRVVELVRLEQPDAGSKATAQMHTQTFLIMEQATHRRRRRETFFSADLSLET